MRWSDDNVQWEVVLHCIITEYWWFSAECLSQQKTGDQGLFYYAMEVISQMPIDFQRAYS